MAAMALRYEDNVAIGNLERNRRFSHTLRNCRTRWSRW